MVLDVVLSDEDIMPLASSPRASGWPLMTTSRSWKLWSSPGWLEWLARGCMSFNKTLCKRIWPIRPRPNLWPPSRPDLNPLDYYIWGILEKVNYCPYKTKQELKDAIVGAMDHMNRMEVKKACYTFCHCLKAVIEKGGHIE